MSEKEKMDEKKPIEEQSKETNHIPAADPDDQAANNIEELKKQLESEYRAKLRKKDKEHEIELTKQKCLRAAFEKYKTDIPEDLLRYFDFANYTDAKVAKLKDEMELSGPDSGEEYFLNDLYKLILAGFHLITESYIENNEIIPEVFTEAEDYAKQQAYRLPKSSGNQKTSSKRSNDDPVWTEPYVHKPRKLNIRDLLPIF